MHDDIMLSSLVQSLSFSIVIYLSADGQVSTDVLHTSVTVSLRFVFMLFKTYILPLNNTFIFNTVISLLQLYTAFHSLKTRWARIYE